MPKSKILSQVSLKSTVEGFTIIELLIVMAIMGILATLIFTVSQTSQMRGRDAQRKSDLKQLSNAMELFFSDHGQYPPSSSGAISACPYSAGGSTDCSWGSGSFSDDTGSVYMRTVPADPKQNRNYYYDTSLTQNAYRLYASLEIQNDPAKNLPADITSCGEDCNYGISSTNTGLTGNW